MRERIWHTLHPTSMASETIIGIDFLDLPENLCPVSNSSAAEGCWTRGRHFLRWGVRRSERERVGALGGPRVGERPGECHPRMTTEPAGRFCPYSIPRPGNSATS